MNVQKRYETTYNWECVYPHLNDQLYPLSKNVCDFHI